MEPTSQPTPERTPTGEQIQVPQVLAGPPSSASAAQPAPMPVLPADAPAAAAPVQPAAQGAVNTNPALAADQDVIEKEWVDKAEETIVKTAGDPHAEEEAVEDLQIDYMKKRYGKDVQKSKD